VAAYSADPFDALQEATRLSEKRRLYADETFFREGWADIIAIFGDATPWFLTQCANVMVKPDGIVGRVVEPVLQHLADHRVDVLAAELVPFDRALVRLLWQFKQNVATLDRLEVLDRLQSACPSLFLLVGAAAEDDVPLSVRLTAIKGPAKLAGRRPEHLRSQLGVHNRFLNVVHSADEPADHVRELGLLFDRSARHDLLVRARDGGNGLSEAHAWTRRLYAQHPRHDLDFRASLRRLANAAGDRSLLCARPSWAKVRDLAVASDVLDPWDVIVVGTHVVQEDVPGVGRLIDSDAQELWRPDGAAVTTSVCWATALHTAPDSDRLSCGRSRRHGPALLAHVLHERGEGCVDNVDLFHPDEF
jgi:hypothetical protein